jgi:Transposase zinc-binding domain
VADALALELQAAPPGSYRQRGANPLQRLFRAHFAELVARYEADFAKRLGKFRLQRITKAVERFLGCGDYSRGVARIQCTNPDCRAEYFRPFSCSLFHLCPSGSQKRTLLLGEYMNEQLLRGFTGKSAACSTTWCVTS